MEEGGQPSDEPRNFYCLFHPFGIQERSFDEVQKGVKVPFGVVLCQHDLQERQNGCSVGGARDGTPAFPIGWPEMLHRPSAYQS